MNRAVLIVCAVVCVLGQETEAQETRDTTFLEPVVITATRIPTARPSIVAGVSVLDGDMLRALGVKQVLEALRLMPGLDIAQTGSFGGSTSLFLRGGESDYVKVLVDGVPVNDPGGAFDFAHLTTENVERIEMVRGPSSVLYGSDAVSGVVQIFTRRGQGPPKAEVGFSAGTYSSTVIDGGVSGSTEAVDYSFNFSRSTTDGFYSFNNDYNNMVLSGHVRVEPDDRTKAAIAVRYNDAEYHYPTDGVGQVVDRNSFSLQDRLVGSLDLSRFFFDRIEGQLLLALNQTDGSMDDKSDGPADTLGFFGFKSLQAVERRSADLRANFHFDETSVATAGVQIEREDERSFNESLSQYGTSTNSQEVSRGSRAYYAQLQAVPVRGLAFNAGVRLDDNDTFGTFFTYRGGATYRFSTGTRLRAAIGKAFKEPTFFENFASSAFVVGNPDLEPERSRSWELGGEQTLFQGRVLVGVTYFDQQFRDLVQYNPMPPNPGDPNYFNVAAANASGLEAEARAMVSNLEFDGSYTRLHTEVTDAGFDDGPGAAFVTGEKMLRRPTDAMSLGARYVTERATFGINLRHVGNRDDRDFSTYPAKPVVLEPYTKFDISTAWTFGAEADRLPDLTLTLRVANLFDREYQEVFGFPARGRTVMIGGKVGF
jgi:vitamin B12 transporter